MIYSVIVIIVFVASIFVLVFYNKKKKHKLPQTMYDRIGVAATMIQKYFVDNGKSSDKSDRCIWNNISFVMAYLTEMNICSVGDNIYISLNFQHLYKDEDENFVCGVWLRDGISFYRKQIKNIKNNTHALPDVIVYNLLNPNIDKISLKDLPLFDVDMIFTMKCWAYINDIFDRFFLSDQNIKNLPRGC